MKKLGITILIISACLLFGGKAFALPSGNLSPDSYISETSNCLCGNIVNFYDPTHPDNHNHKSCDLSEQWSTTIWPESYGITLNAVETEGTQCLGTYEECAAEGYACLTGTFSVGSLPAPPTPPSGADSDITDWGASITGTAKDNIFKIIGDNIVPITLIFVGILGIFFVMRLIRKSTGGR